MTRAEAESGQALTEYLVVVTAMALALWIPVGDAPLAQILLGALARAYRNYSFVVAAS